MSVGDDIKEAIVDVGSTYTVIRDDGDISGEYALLEYSSQVTKPLTIEHFRRAMVSHDTEMVTGDILEFDSVNERYLVTNKMSELFENAVVHFEAVLYKCNISSGELLRPSGETWDDPTDLYHKTPSWEVIKDNCDAMQVASLYGNDLETDQQLGLMGLNRDEVLLPHSLGAQALDRWQPTSGEYYMVSRIETRRYPDIDVLVVEEDHR